MAVLVEGLTLVLRSYGIDLGGPPAWSAFRAATRFGAVARGGLLVSVSGMDREGLRLCLVELGAIGYREAWTLLATTERPSWRDDRTVGPARRTVEAGTSELALVFRLQARRVPWLEVAEYRVGGEYRVEAAYLPGIAPDEIAVPQGWTPRATRRKPGAAAAAHPAIRKLAAPLPADVSSQGMEAEARRFWGRR